jgi:hypothetical protein
MGLNHRAKNEKAGKSGFNDQFGFQGFLLFTIQKTCQQTCREYNDQNIHHVLLIIYPQITQIFADKIG